MRVYMRERGRHLSVLDGADIGADQHRDAVARNGQRRRVRGTLHHPPWLYPGDLAEAVPGVAAASSGAPAPARNRLTLVGCEPCPR